MPTKAKRASLAETEDVGMSLQEREKASTRPSEEEYRSAYKRVQAGEISQVQAAEQLGVSTSKGSVYRLFKKLEIDYLGQKETPEAKSQRLHVKPLPQSQEQVQQAESPTLPIIELGIQYLVPEKLDNTRYQPRAVIAAGDPLVHDIELRGGNIYPVLVQQSTLGVVDGHRRVNAITRINQEHPEKQLLVKCDVQDLTEQQAALLAYQANVLTNPLSEGERDKWIYALLSQYGLTVKRVCHDIPGLTENNVNNIYRAFEKTTDAVKERLASGKISTGVARAIVTLEPAQQTRLVKKAEAKQLSVHDVEDEAKEIKGREVARETIYKHMISNRLENVNIELKHDKRSYGDPKSKWCGDVIEAVYGNKWHREGGHLVEQNDVKAAAKRAGIEFSMKPEAVILCDICPWNRHQKCGFNLKSYPKREKCEKYIPQDSKLRFEDTFCRICGGLFNGIDFDLHRQGEHNICTIKELVSKGALSGLCETCGNACGLIDQGFDFFYCADDTPLRKIRVDSCGEYEAEPDLAAMNEGALERVEKLIAKHTEQAEIVEKNHAFTEANEAKEEIVGNIGIKLAETMLEATTVETSTKPKSPARFREDRGEMIASDPKEGPD